MSCAKMAKLIKLLFETWTRVGPRKYLPVLEGSHWRHLANTVEPRMCGTYVSLC